MTRVSSPEPAPAAGQLPATLASLAQATLVYGAGGVLNRFVTLLMLPVLTRYLAAADYGLSALLDVLSALLVSLFSLGVGSSMTVGHFDAPDERGRREVLSTALLLLFGSSAALVAATSVAVFAGWGPSLEGSTSALLLLTALDSAILILQQPFAMHLQFTRRPARLVAIHVASTVILVVCSLVGVVVLQRGVVGLWEGRVVAHLIGLALLGAHVPWSALVVFRRRVAGDLLRLGLPMIPSFASLFVLLQSSRYFLSWFAELEVVGVYSAGVQLGSVVGLAVSAFSTAWTPFFMPLGARPADAARILGRAATYYTLVFGGLSLAVIALARPALLVLTPAPFHDGFRVAGFAATAQFMVGASLLLMPPATYARELRFIGLTRVVAALAAVPIHLLLIGAAGMTGAGLALAAGPSLMTLLLWVGNRRRGFLRVCYEPRRLLPFAGLYLATLVLLAQPRSLGLASEVAFAAPLLLLVLLATWSLADPADRRRVLLYLRARLGSATGAREGHRG